MDWKNFLVGIGLLIGAFLLYKIRKGRYYSDEYAFANKATTFQNWMAIIMVIICAIVFIIKSLPI